MTIKLYLSTVNFYCITKFFCMTHYICKFPPETSLLCSTFLNRRETLRMMSCRNNFFNLKTKFFQNTCSMTWFPYCIMICRTYFIKIINIADSRNTFARWSRKSKYSTFFNKRRDFSKNTSQILKMFNYIPHGNSIKLRNAEFFCCINFRESRNYSWNF